MPRNKPIKYTEDLSAFDRSEFQRMIRPAKRRAVYVSMVKHGRFWHEKPIICYRDKSGKFIIIDGHHRLDVALELGFGVWFVETTKDMENAIMELNEGASWSSDDTVTLWAKRGKNSYQDLCEWVDRLRVPTLRAAQMLGMGSLDRKALKDGRFQVVSDHMLIVLEAMMKEDAPKRAPVMRSETFLNAFVRAWKVEGFDVARFRKHLAENPAMLEKKANLGQMAQCFQDIYNFRERTRFPLALEIVNQK